MTATQNAAIAIGRYAELHIDPSFLGRATWSTQTRGMALALRDAMNKINAILAAATVQDIAGLANWGALNCRSIQFVLYESTTYLMQAAIARETPSPDAERQHGWEKPPDTAPQMTQMRNYVKQKLAETGYEGIEIIAGW